MITNICTSIVQSRRLLKLGLDPNTADMCWPDYKRLVNYIIFPHFGKSDNKEDLPAWSLTSLLKIIKDYTIQTTTTGKVFIVCSFNEHPWSLVSQAYDNEVDACFDLVCRLIQGGHIKTEKK